MIKNSLRAVAVVLALSGCMQKVWINPSATYEQSQKDFNECKYDAVKYNGGSSMYNSGMTSAIQSGFEQGLRENEIMTSCMTSKGYYLTTKEQAQSSLTPIKSTKTAADISCLNNIDKSVEAYLAEHAESEEFRKLEQEKVKTNKAACNH